ncbi:hypothetical protein BJ973_000527 [Actinoplanes tereljensis]|uniref:DUF4407 domain-containing protein n=1 Tax=Paractinoplanes tereljensis TaxID=571912 RepID=A0A919NRW4_9ACTN|nr:DUF4407 domain-containing protein [Actinoplanes tereljensis]GIF23115.1 hypothetical protein Ate02nite_58450 [Actinoplanes tereljensis]
MIDLDRHSTGTLLCRLGGADAGVLSLAPKARREYIALALVMLATASLAVLSMAFAMTDGLKANPVVGVLIGLFWGAIILTVDRALIINLKPKGGKGRMFLMIVPRLLMAALLGLVISTPLTLRIFNDEIAAQMTHDQIAAANTAAKELASGDLTGLFNSKNAEVKKYEEIVAGRYTYTAPGLTQAQQEYDKAKTAYEDKQKDAETAYRRWQCELYGVGCEATSKKRGDGPLAQALKKEYQNRKAEAGQAEDLMNTQQSALLNAQKQNSDDGETALAAAQADAEKQLAVLRPQRDNLQQQLQALNDAAQAKRQDGLLAQLVALGHLDDQSKLALIAHLLLAALLFMIELLPVAIKTLIAAGPTTVYERAEKLDDDLVMKLAAARANREQAKQAEIDQRAIDSEVRVAKKVQEKVEDLVTEIAMVAVDQWGEEVRRSAASYTHQQQPPPVQNGGGWHPQIPGQQPGPYNLPPVQNPPDKNARQLGNSGQGGNGQNGGGGSQP